MPHSVRQLPHPRFLLFLATFAIGAVLASFLPGLPMRPELPVILAFDLAVLVFIASSLPLWRDVRIARIRDRAARDDGGRTLLLLISGMTMASILVALGLELQKKPTMTLSGFAVVIVTLGLAWIFVNLVYSYHYAHLYYDQTAQGDRGGLTFPGDAPPVFADFCYFSFVVGMTCQVSDVVVTNASMRRVVLVHGLLSFFFNLGVLALTVNVLSGFL